MLPTTTMGSPTRQSLSLTSSPYLHQATTGGIRKRSSTTSNNSLATVCPERLYQTALDIAASKESSAIPAAAGFQWITPQQSPQPDTVFHEPSILDSFPHWTAPTPPLSDSGLPPPLNFDPKDGLVTSSDVAFSNDFAFEQPAAADMSSSLGFLLPSQYGSGADDDDYPSDNRYQIPPMRLTQSTASSGTPAYAQAGSSSPSHYQSRPAAARTAGPSIPPINHSPLPSPHPGGPSYSSTASSSQSRSLFDPGMHPPPPQQHYPGSYHANQPPPPPQYAGSSASDILHKPAPSDASARAMSQRPKPQCWEHGCNGRQFSTFSNLLRHQREKSGTSSKSYCPKCGAEFTRTTARNGHLAHDKCTKAPRQGSDEK